MPLAGEFTAFSIINGTDTTGEKGIRGEDERAQFGLCATDMADIGAQVAANITDITPQTGSGVTFEVVPDLLGGMSSGHTPEIPP